MASGSVSAAVLRVLNAENAVLALPAKFGERPSLRLLNHRLGGGVLGRQAVVPDVAAGDAALGACLGALRNRRDGEAHLAVLAFANFDDVGSHQGALATS